MKCQRCSNTTDVPKRWFAGRARTLCPACWATVESLAGHKAGDKSGGWRHMPKGKK